MTIWKNKYADSMRGDRDLKLSGYEVFRFGATELRDRERARTQGVGKVISVMAW